MVERDTRLIPGTKREGRAEERGVGEEGETDAWLWAAGGETGGSREGGAGRRRVGGAGREQGGRCREGGAGREAQGGRCREGGAGREVQGYRIRPCEKAALLKGV